MNILALDLGTTTGFAFVANGVTLSGTWKFHPRRFDGGGVRFLRFLNQLNETADAMGRIDLVAYEEVRRHLGTDAAHIYGGFQATLTQWCEGRGTPYEAVPVQAIKKFATGKGNADKAAMIAAVESWGFKPADDNEADATALLRLKMLENGK